jgi:hypothetical protein
MPAANDTNLVERVARRLRVEADRASGRLQDASRRRRNAGREFRPIFVAGAIGSGTSLLAASLAQRFEVAGVTLESARHIDRRSEWWIDRVHNFASIRAYEEALAPASSWSPEQIREDLFELYRSKADVLDSADAEGGPMPFIDKGPNTNLARAGFLAETFPAGRFVLIFRDPVANIEGFRRKWLTFRHDRLAESTRFWAKVHESFLEQAQAFPDRFVTVEYEALVADYDQLLASLGPPLEIEPAAHTRPVEARAMGAGRGLRGVEGGAIRVVRDANARSYATLSSDEIEEIRETLTPLHERLRALARSAPVIPDSAAESPSDEG